MLVPFAIDAESLSDPGLPWTEPAMRACSKSLLDFWRHIGLLVHDGERFDGSKMQEAVAGLPQNLRSLWQEMLQHYPPIPGGAGWDGTLHPSLSDALRAALDVGFVDDTKAFVEFGMTEDQDEALLPRAEASAFVVCRLSMAHHASVVKQAQTLAQQNIQAGESWQTIWRTRFHRLAAAPSPLVKVVTIVDRYALERHIQWESHSLSGLERFLRELDKDAPAARSVWLYTALTPELAKIGRDELTDQLAGILGRLTHHRIRWLKLCLIDNKVFGRLMPDRYVRFNCYVWTLGHGLECLEGPQATRLNLASFKTTGNDLKQLEQELLALVEPVQIQATA